MSNAANAQKGDNSAKKFKKFTDELVAIKASLLTAHDYTQKSDASINDALGNTLDLGWLIADKRAEEDDEDWSFLKEFVMYHDAPWTAKCDSNIFHALVTVAFDKVHPDTGHALTSQPQLSKYRAILRYAFTEGLRGDDLVKQLSRMTLSGVYEKAVSWLRFDPLDRFVEDEDQRFERAKSTLLELETLPNGKFTDEFPMPESSSGFVQAMLHVDEGGFKVVGIVSGDKEDVLRQKVAKLVPAEARRNTKKLSAEPFYSLYVACDLFQRFLPAVAGRDKWSKAEKIAQRPILTSESSAEDLEAYKTWWRENGSASEESDNVTDTQEERDEKAMELAKKFLPLDALRFVAGPDGWQANSIT